MNIVHHVMADDWEGIYINKKLIVEGHRISGTEMSRVLEQHQPFAPAIQVYADDDWMYENGNLPEDFDEVVVGEDG